MAGEAAAVQVGGCGRIGSVAVGSGVGDADAAGDTPIAHDPPKKGSVMATTTKRSARSATNPRLIVPGANGATVAWR